MAAAARVPFLEQQYNHVALPRNVPGKEDGNLHRIEEALLERMLDAAARLTPHVATDLASHIQGLRATLLACQVLHVGGTIGKAALTRELRDLSHHKMLVLHIAPQNCALLVYRQELNPGEHTIVFEAFETSATADKVLAAKGALQWDFPGCAVSVPASKFYEEAFQEALATFIEQASSEPVTKFAAITWKAAATIPEIRDTSDPALISGLLMTILEANGTAVSVPCLRKRVRDTVVFDNARTPWRRSAFYLVLRVAVQRYLYYHLGAEVGRLYYKTLMCLLHAQLLENILKRIPLDAVFSFRQKLGRRLAKLASDVHETNRSSTGRYADLLLSFESSFETTLVTTGGYLKRVWRTHRESRERFIPLLRQYALPHEFHLRMKNSGRFLRGVLSARPTYPRSEEQTSDERLQSYLQSKTSVKPYMKAVSSHIASSKLVEDVIFPAKQSTQPEGLLAIQMSRVIRDYVARISTMDLAYPNQKSQHLLHVMELWVLMDQDAVACYPLLKEYHPGFDADILDPIQLLTREEMIRSKEVRKYLHSRYRARSNAESKTIFDDPADDCFAVQYYNREDPQGELPVIREEIEQAAEVARDAKSVEWEKKSKHHAQTINKRNEKECIYDTSVGWDGTTQSRHRRPCDWHDLHNEAKAFRIQIHEHPLPSYEPAVKAALFELQCPEVFAAYRDATWLLLSKLCNQTIEKLDRISLIREYSQLRQYVNNTSCQVTLGSYKKAHLECHYASWGFPIGLEEVIRTCGLKPKYYDRLGEVWTHKSKKASFWHHFPVKCPLNSPLVSLELDYAMWPTSNEVQASQARCPQGVGIHEFTALQGLLTGTHSRWLDLLREMGSTNLNFSSESTWVLVLRLVLQLGPNTVADSLCTDVHRALSDDGLCSKLLQQVQYRLEAIQRNWREPVQMELLITVLLKVTSLTLSTTVRNEGISLLQEARKITDGWRKELQPMVTEDPNVLQSAIWASLLCKRTMHVDEPPWLDPESLRMYLDASISLQYNLAGSFDAMPYNMRNAIVQDILFAYDYREVVSSAILATQETFRAALEAVWYIPDDYKLNEAGFQGVPGAWYLSYTLHSLAEQHSYFVHYNYVYGTLLINGQEMGTLPQSYRMDRTYQHILGTKNPIVYPSPLRGMDFALSETVRGHRIHLGYRDNRLIIRADRGGQLLEFIPRHAFGLEGPTPDLPRPLVEDCYHWLHVYSGHIEIRQSSQWASKLMNWWIRWHPSGFYHAVRRFQEPEQTTLLDTGSDLVKSVTRIFSHFEFPSQILVFASVDGKIFVDLKRMELSFHINQEGLLQSPRLGGIILQNQDAGTWYGLMNKIVVHSIANRRQKSILVPWGGIRVSKDGPHVSVDIEMGQGVYLKYAINDVLGRIDCAPEPRLLYMKALLHAYTSHAIADPLTRRTGTEEALYLLQTGTYQPWNPLLPDEIATLHRIAELSPKRGYYPPNARYMETVLWEPKCTIHMQDDRYATVVATILRRSANLSRFFLDREVQEIIKLEPDITHLAARAVGRSNLQIGKKNGNQDVPYSARDSRRASQDRLNVLEVSKLLLNWESTCSLDTTLTALLHDAPVLGGYDKYYRKCLLTDHLAVDIKAEWGALAQKSLQCSVEDRSSLMFLLGTIAFSSDADLNLLRVLVSFAMIPEIRAIKAPSHAAYFHFRADGAPPASYLISLMERARMPFSETGFRKRSQLVKAESLHGPSVDRACELLAGSIIQQWPASDIDLRRLVAIDPTYLNVDQALADVASEWTRLTRNHELSLYLEQVQEVLSRMTTHQTKASLVLIASSDTELMPSSLYPVRSREYDDQSLSDLMKARVVTIEEPRTTAPPHTSWSYAGALTARSGNTTLHSTKMHNFVGVAQTKKAPLYPRVAHPPPQEIGMLRDIVANFKDPSSFVQCRYAKEMDASIDALQKHVLHARDTTHITFPQVTTADILPAKDVMAAAADRIRCSLQDPQAKWLRMADAYHKLTTIELLTELRTTAGTAFGAGMKEALVAFGVAVSKLQRLLRIQDAQKRWKKQQERDEWANKGHGNWSPMTFPDWLLLEIDGDILLRDEQVQVALATVSPQTNENSVLQLLMGKGKTSCILPMVAALLADQANLARVVVPRALLLQSAQVMQAKLGGLVDRELMHIPFSRKTSPAKALMSLYRKLHERLKARRGILIALPEHILSFKLSGLQQLCDEKLETASIMIETQRWLDEHTRDVLDECDVSLAIRTQLIYPSGTQATVDGHPMRWQVTQAVLHLVKDFSSSVQSRYPRSIEVVNRGSAGFPLLYFLRKDAEDYLIELLVKIICKGQTPLILPCAEYPAALMKDVQGYISKPAVRSQTISKITSFFRDKPTLMRAVNLLRGMFVHRILITTLKKRWNVQYGLHPTRVPIAVPYLAKGVPSPTAEWGHPDVAITLTCLSFYYQGLSVHQFKEAFAHLVKTDEPSIQYEKWFPKGIDIPKELDDYAAINAEDMRQLGELYQVVRYSASLMDFYLNNFVFPKYAKTFSLKLQASGWNLFPSCQDNKGPRVTGFSGTNDSRHQLPLLVQQQDLPQLAHTNAEVPYYLLAPRNQSYVRMTFANGARWTETDMINNLASNYMHIPNNGHYSNGSGQGGRVRILIDAGAQVLEHSNKDFAKAWLDADHEAAAAVYFDNDHRVWVLYRTGRRIPLVASPFVDDLDRCVVYLDESHCRGTDIKFPPNAKAALTLGQHLTKDTLVQAAMRLRLLGQTQSVTFFSPVEVHQGILDRLPKGTRVHHQPTSGDVLRWVFGQTCETMEQLEPSYFAQTLQYLQQEQARSEHPEYLQDLPSREAFLATVRIKEALSLKQLYEPRGELHRRAVANTAIISWKPALHSIYTELVNRKKRFQDRGSAVHASALEEVEIEQEREAEREVEIEVENVREVQQALLFKAHKVKTLHEDIKHFAAFGRLVPGSDAYQPMFSVLGQTTSLGRKHTVNSSMKSGLRISAEYSRTIEVYEPNDNYVRSSHWLLWSTIGQQALLVSPEEADQLIPAMQEQQQTSLNDGSVHLIIYAAPVTRRMLHFNQLDYYAIPALPTDFKAPVWLRVEMGLFAGRLYLEWDEYYQLLEYLGLDENLSQHREKNTFAKKPLTFVHEWLALRRKGQDFEHTPMGFVTTGKPLTENHPFFRKLAHGDDPALRQHVARAAPGQLDSMEEEEDHDDHDDEEFVPAVQHVDDSEGEDEGFESSDEEAFVDAEDGE
ncbi:hypothetical protein GT037_006027 [Alternaria burnsii]|uniref:ubiquitinyl hydrolase 1 n=1 Tax=Alternaria burnsii TaxID=1187904 RepID=A0A8H7EFD1_9PLEO|nr:uncharacterized protein GT037_006027 [Alternaria burnsii]KAF7676522.1 hypothetical protein GT037_006027 [Alternaria burnsii]